MPFLEKARWAEVYQQVIYLQGYGGHLELYSY